MLRQVLDGLQRIRVIPVALVGGVLLAGCRASPHTERWNDVVIGGFESSTYGAWMATGPAFARGPALGEALRPLEIENVAGNRSAFSWSSTSTLDRLILMEHQFPRPCGGFGQRLVIAFRGSPLNQ